MRAARVRATLRRPGRKLGATMACAACVCVATAASPQATLAAEGPDADRLDSLAWSPFFASERPVAIADPRHLIVLFDDPSLGEWHGAGRRQLTPAEQRTWVQRATRLQQRRLDALAATGVQFRIEHRYVRAVNGVSIIVHGDGAQLLRGAPSVDRIVPVRTIWPLAASSGSTDAAATSAAADGAARAVGAAPAAAAIRVGVLDAAIDAAHAQLQGRIADEIDVIGPDGGTRRAARPGSESHATSIAAAVLRGAGAETPTTIVPVRVLERQPVRDGGEAVIGDSDDLLAGIERAVDPDRDGSAEDALDIAVIASGTPYAGFTDSAEDRAVRGAAALGTLIVAAAGNDGDSGGAVGTVGSVSASDAALSVGAADLRGRTPAANVRVRGDGVDETFTDAPVLGASPAGMPDGSLPVIVVEDAGDEVVDYLDAELRSRVAGSIVLLAAREDVLVADQARAAGDAGARAVLVGADDARPAAGTIDVAGVDVPIIAISRDDARSLRDSLADGVQLTVAIEAGEIDNPAHGSVAGFSSTGPTWPGSSRPDVLGPGVGMQLAAAGRGSASGVFSGTSVAAGWVAGQAAAVWSRRQGLGVAAVRGAMLGTALPLGEDRNRPPVTLQGAGVVDIDRAVASAWRAGAGRVEFGAVAAGTSASRPLDLVGIDSDAAAPDAARILLDDGGDDAGITPRLAAGKLVLDVRDDARRGPVGGWLVLPEQGIRVPWSATIRDTVAPPVPISFELTSDELRPVSGPGAFAATMTIAVGGDDAGAGRLGLGAVQRLEVRLVDAAGRDSGLVGAFDEMLPGVYTIGLTGTDTAGTRIAPGSWTLQVRSVSALDPDGSWQAGPSRSVTVTAARSAG